MIRIIAKAAAVVAITLAATAVVTGTAGAATPSGSDTGVAVSAPQDMIWG